MPAAKPFEPSAGDVDFHFKQPSFISQIMKAPCPILRTATVFSFFFTAALHATLVSHYTFDETSGTTATDSGPAVANGTIGSNVTLGTPGKFGTAFTFGNDATQPGVVDMGNAATFAAINTSQAVTISVWMKWTSSTDNRDCAIFLGNDTVAASYLDFGTLGGVNTANLGGVYLRNRTASTQELLRGSALNNGQWHHIAYTVNAAAEITEVYIDGTLAGTNTTPAFAFPAFNNFEVGRLGRSSPTDAYAGSVDELKIFDTILSASEISALAQGPVANPDLEVAAIQSFTNTGATTTLSVPFSNEGSSQTLILSGANPITISGPDAAYFNVAAFDNNLAPDASGVISIGFNPNGAGPYTATLTVASNDSLQPSTEININVTVSDPIAVVTPATMNFGSFVTAPGLQTMVLTVANDGAGTDLTVNDVFVTGNPAFTVNAPIPITVPPGGSTEITVSFDPAALDGSFAANLQVLTDGYNQSSFSVPLSAEVKLINPDASLVSHFSFENTGNLGDDSGSFNHDGTPVGDAQRTSLARIGTGALLLDGTGDLIDLGVGSGADYTTQLVANGEGFTLACWAYVPTGTSLDRTRFFSAYANGSANLSEGWGVGQRNATRQLVGTTYGKADYLAPANTAPALGGWHHYAYVFRSVPVNRLDFYVDGALVNSQANNTTTGFNPATTVGFAIGALGKASPSFEGFSGRLDDLRIYDRELPASNVADLYNTAPPVSAYETWASSYGLNPTGNGGYLQDADSDGARNSVEFMLGSSPVSGLSANLPTATRSGGNFTFVYRRKTAAVAAGFVDRVDYTDDLADISWTPALHGSGGVTIGTTAIDAETEEVTVTIPAAASRMFARLVVTEP